MSERKPDIEELTRGDLRSEDVNLVVDIRDEQGRRRYTLGSVDGAPSMIPDAEGFWTPANDDSH